MSLERHLLLGWNILNLEMGEFIVPIPPQQRVSNSWYKGTADAIYQNIYHIEKENPSRILILSGDHIYKMDYSEMLQCHLENDAQVTIAANEVDKAEAPELGILEVDSSSKILGFEEKPPQPKTLPSKHKSHKCFASMGVYMFNTDFLVKWLTKDASDASSSHDFGKDIIPKIVAGKNRINAYNFNSGKKLG